MTAISAGMILFALEVMNFTIEKSPCSMPLNIIDVIKKPDITKNTSTPAKPPGAYCGEKWKTTTDKTAKALRPFISSLNVFFCIAFIHARFLVKRSLPCL